MKPITIAGMAAAIVLVVIPEVAQAQYGYGHVRRATRRRTAVVVGTTVHAADQQAAAQQQAAQQQAAPPQPAAPQPTPAPAPPAPVPAPAPPPAPAGQPLPVGTVVPQLPLGCSTLPVGGEEYYHCGPDYYRRVFQGNTLVYVTTAPPQ